MAKPRAGKTSALMAVLEYYQILSFPLCILFLCYYYIFRNQKKSLRLITNWPLVGMLPGLLCNIHRLHDYITEILSECGGTFQFKGPLFSNMDMLITCNPANINYIFNKNFSNYPKGPEYRKIFEILGEGIFNADSELWELHRRTTLSLMNAKFYTSVETTIWEKVQTGLLPVLDHFSDQGTEIDMQDILERFSFDTICQLFLGYNPGSLSTELPDIPCEKALSDALEPLLHRHIVPECIWKLQKWLKIGNEKKLMKAWKAFDDFIYPHISLEPEDRDGQDNVNIFTIFRKAYEESSIRFSRDLREFLRDTYLGLLFAGRDSLSTTLTWFFWLLAANPTVETKILQEIETVLHIKDDGKWRFFNVQESRKLLYLHAALYETLRLFPPIGLELKSPTQPDNLPSSDYVHQDTRVIISFYSTGRMESVWGKDCLDFTPERWISAGGGLNYEPSFKFPAFNVGPRTCPGKEMSLIEMKMVAAAIIYHYHVQVVEGHPVVPRDSIMLKAKHGLKIRLSRKNVC